MKILVVCQYYYPEPFRITDICEKLVQNGNEVTVLTGLPNYPEGYVSKEYKFFNKRKEVINDVSVIRTFEIGRRKSTFFLMLNYISFAISGSIKALFLKSDFDIVFVNQLSPVFMVLPAIIYKLKNRKKIVLYCLDLWPESLTVKSFSKESKIYNLVLTLSKWIYNQADKILVTSNMFKKYFDDVLRIDSSEIDYLPQYAEDIFKPSETKEVESKVINLVFAGNIGEAQSVETIVLAANELKENNKFHFHIVGDGSKYKSCLELAKKLSLSNITFYGRLDLSEMPKFYNLADAMLLTLIDDESLSYTLPGKVQTYLANGKPIIGAINGEGANLIKESCCGLVCNAEDYFTLSELILNLKKEDLFEYSKESINYYLNNFESKTFMSKLTNKFIEMGVYDV